MDLNPPRGTRDFFPEDMRLQNWLTSHFHAVADLFAFEEYDAPVVESEALYIRKAGEEITEQLYNFADKSGRRLALRSEMTPSLARLVLRKGGSLALPAKWYSIPQCWRYERMTRGRRREHYQWNMDIVGVPEVTAEAELIAALTAFFQRLSLGPEDIGIKISNRKILQGLLQGLGVSDEQFAPVCVLVDKLEKVPRQAIEGDMAALGLDEGMIDRIIEALSLDQLDDIAGIVGGDHPGIVELRRLFDLAADYGYVDWLTFEASLVRGLAYYTGIVFEAFDRSGDLRALCGGGRYDRLLSTFGGKDAPACGFGFGDAVIVELLKDKGLLPEIPRTVDDLVFAFSAELRPAAIQVAAQLRRAGRSVDLILEDKKVRWAFRRADQVGAARLVLLAPDEWASGQVRVKTLATGAEENLPLDQLT
ncbi:MAG: histidine--tRNA ligase [Candidatus Latescibacteria bacterium]|nr:histidine--tRNA ligase [Candidatus Latescibacterota bacterium]